MYELAQSQQLGVTVFCVATRFNLLSVDDCAISIHSTYAASYKSSKRIIIAFVEVIILFSNNIFIAVSGRCTRVFLQLGIEPIACMSTQASVYIHMHIKPYTTHTHTHTYTYVHTDTSVHTFNIHYVRLDIDILKVRAFEEAVIVTRTVAVWS